MNRILTHPHLTTVAVLCRYTQARDFIRATRKTSKKMTFIFYDSFTSGINFETETVSSFYMLYESSPVPAFYNNFKETRVSDFKTAEEWKTPFVEGNFGCSYDNSSTKPSCSDFENATFGEGLKTKYMESRYQSLNMDCVFTFAHGLHQLISDKCPSAFLGNKSALADCVDGEALYSYILNASFPSSAASKALISFAKDGDAKSRIIIRQMNASNKLEEVGSYYQWNDALHIKHSRLKWAGYLKEGTPQSVCSFPCKINERKIIKNELCCWECRRCNPNELVLNQTTCKPCPKFYWPDQIRWQNCKPLPHNRNKFQGIIAWLCIGFNVFGLLATVFLLVSYIAFRNTSLIKASSFRTSVVLICISGLIYINVFLFFMDPTTLTCSTRLLGFQLPPCILSTGMLMRTVRIYRIFKASDKCKSRLRFVSEGAINLHMVGVVVLQVSGISIGFL